MKKDLGTVACAALVVLAYVFFASDGKWTFRSIDWFQTHIESPGADYYARLAEGFRTGHLYMAAPVDARLETLPDPLDPKARGDNNIEGLWDASYFRGHYYLYFTPLPALMIYLPFRLIRGLYPPDSLAALVFAVWTFIVALLFLRRALKQPRIPRVIWILVAAFGNVIAFSLPEVRVYEVAVLCGTAMSTTWAWSLLRFMEEQTTRRAMWVGLWLALSIAARPNLIVLIVPTFLAMRSLRFARSALIPLAVVAAILLGYNFARFRQPFEFGRTYQFEFVSMKGRRLCSICNMKEVLRFFNNSEHFLFWAPMIDGRFPYVSLTGSRMDPEVSAPLGSDIVIGVVTMLPLVVFGVFFALAKPRRDDPSVLIMFGAWLALASLCTCWWVVARYSLDFMLLMTLATAVLIEEGLRHFDSIPLRIAIITMATYSILLGFFLGFEGQGGAFRRYNPELFQTIGKTFHVKLRT